MDSTAQAHRIEAQIDQLMARQIGYARYCRTRAAAVRESAEQIKFPELRATMLKLALTYERIARSVEQWYSSTYVQFRKQCFSFLS